MPVLSESAGEILSDAIFFHIPPEGRFADAQFIGNFLPIAVILLEQVSQLQGFRVFDQYDLLRFRHNARL